MNTKLDHLKEECDSLEKQIVELTRLVSSEELNKFSVEEAGLIKLQRDAIAQLYSILRTRVEINSRR